MDQLEFPEGGPREAYHIWVQGDVPIMRYGREVDGLYSVFPREPSSADFLGGHARRDVLREAEIGGENRDVVAEPGNAVREGANFDDGTAAFLKRKIGLDHHQHTHSVSVS